MYSIRPLRRSRAEAGTSLLEVLLAAVLLLVISVFVLPLFSTSLISTTAGGRSSELSTLAQQSLEMIEQRPIEHPDWDLTGATCVDVNDPCVKETAPANWYWPSSGIDTLGDERWLQAPGSAAFHWRRTLTVRKYSIADVSAGNIDDTGTTVETLGHPELFDTPLSQNYSNADIHIAEFRVNIAPDTDRILGVGEQQQQLTVSLFRAN